MTVETETTAAQDILVQETSIPKKKKSKKGKEVQSEETEEAHDATKKKRKKGKAEAEAVESGDKDIAVEGGSSSLTTKKRKKKSDDAVDETQADAEAVVEPDRKAKRKRAKPAEDAEQSSKDLELAEQRESRKKQKREKYKSQAQEQAVEASDRERKKKKHKNKSHGFKDPSGDESLSEQSSKALAYAYLKADDPSTWKFNKARQNWLIRNIWSEEAVPADYVPLVNLYISSVQGGSREALIETCRKLLDEPALPSNPETEAATETSQAETSHPRVSFQPAIKEQRARELLDLLQQPGS